MCVYWFRDWCGAVLPNLEFYHVIRQVVRQKVRTRVFNSVMDIESDTFHVALGAPLYKNILESSLGSAVS